MSPRPAQGIYEVPGTGWFDRTSGQFLGKGTGRAPVGDPTRARPRPLIFTKPRQGSTEIYSFVPGLNNGRPEPGPGYFPVPRSANSRVADYNDAQGNQYDGNSGRMIVPASMRRSLPAPPAQAPRFAAVGPPVHPMSTVVRPGPSSQDARQERINATVQQYGTPENKRVNLQKQAAASAPLTGFGRGPGLGYKASGSPALLEAPLFPAVTSREQGDANYGSAPDLRYTASGAPEEIANPYGAQVKPAAGTDSPGIEQWKAAHRNSQRSVIDGMNIVERYEAQQAKRAQAAPAMDMAAGMAPTGVDFGIAAQMDLGLPGGRQPQLNADPMPGRGFDAAANNTVDSSWLPSQAPNLTHYGRPPAPSRMYGDQSLESNTLKFGGSTEVLDPDSVSDPGFTNRWIKTNMAPLVSANRFSNFAL